jgi:hypothetical protein
MNLENRKGIFRIAKLSDFSLMYDAIIKVSAQCAIVRAEYDQLGDCFVYHAYSSHFDEIEGGAVVPTYEAMVRNVNGRPEFERFQRID